MTEEERHRHQAVFDRPEVRQKMSDNHWSKNDPVAHRTHAKTMRTNWKLTDGGRDRLRLAKQGKQSLVECPKCGKTGGEIALKRWHFENCGQGVSEKTRQKLVAAQIGKKRSDETKQRMRVAQLSVWASGIRA